MICPCCGGDADHCVLGPTGCSPRAPEGEAEQAAREYELWWAARQLAREHPDFLSDAGRTYAATASPDGMPF